MPKRLTTAVRIEWHRQKRSSKTLHTTAQGNDSVAYVFFITYRVL